MAPRRLKMGLGKTLTSLSYIYSQRPEVNPTLVICSKTVMNSWREEYAKFFVTMQGTMMAFIGMSDDLPFGD